MTEEERTARIDALERKLEASRSMGTGYADRITKIEEWLKELRDAQ